MNELEIYAHGTVVRGRSYRAIARKAARERRKWAREELRARRRGLSPNRAMYEQKNLAEIEKLARSRS